MIYIKCLNNYEEGIPVNNYISIVNENNLRFYREVRIKLKENKYDDEKFFNQLELYY